MSEHSSLGTLEKEDLIHAAIGGGVCFLLMFLLTELAQIGLQQILINLGMIGVMVFKEPFQIARLIFVFGIAHLTSGFCGGLYTGYKVLENMKIILLIPGVIGTVGFVLLLLIMGRLGTPDADYIGYVLLPFIGSVTGSYLGGYAINWSVEEEEQSFEDLTFDDTKK